MSFIGDLINEATTPIKTIADAYVAINNNKFAAGLASSQSTIDELKATTSLLQQQNEAQRLALENQRLTGGGLNVEGWGKWLVLGVVAFGVYKWLK